MKCSKEPRSNGIFTPTFKLFSFYIYLAKIRSSSHFEGVSSTLIVMWVCIKPNVTFLSNQFSSCALLLHYRNVPNDGLELLRLFFVQKSRLKTIKHHHPFNDFENTILYSLFWDSLCPLFSTTVLHRARVQLHSGLPYMYSTVQVQVVLCL